MRKYRAGIAALLIAALMSTAMTGCGSSDTEDSNSDTSSAAEVVTAASEEAAETEAVTEAANDTTTEAKADDTATTTAEDTAATTLATTTVAATTLAADDPYAIDAEDPTSFLKQDATFTWGQGISDTPDVNVNNGMGNNGGSVVEYVVVTQPNGQPATDAAGETMTEAVTKAPNANNGGSYTPSLDRFRSYWLDMSKANGAYDKVFNGDFLVVTFKVLENTPSGNYEITMQDLDFVNWDEQQLQINTINGCVTVGNAIQQAPSGSDNGSFTIAADCVKAQPGDTVDVIFHVSNNPGIVGYLFNFNYDKNALEIVDARIGDDCKRVVRSMNT